MIKFNAILLSLAIPFLSFGQNESGKKIIWSVSADFSHSFFYDGHVRVRENSFEGTYLKLKQDLGMYSWISLGGTISLNLRDKNIFEFTYTRHYFDGTHMLSNPTWYNGSLYAANSEGDIHSTIYRGFEWIWKARIRHTGNTNYYLRTSIHYERLKFYVDAPVKEDSPTSETYEAFWRQQLPQPSVGMALNHKLTSHWSLCVEMYASYLPKIKTWMQEGGNIYLAQTNMDIRVSALYTYKFLSISAGTWFKHYRIKEESREDENEFLLNGIGDKLSLTINF